jgi:hypothetical protein
VEKSRDYDVIISNTCITAKSIVTELLKKHPVKAQILVSLSFYKQPEGEKEISEKPFAQSANLCSWVTISMNSLSELKSTLNHE